MLFDVSFVHKSTETQLTDGSVCVFDDVVIVEITVLFEHGVTHVTIVDVTLPLLHVTRETELVDEQLFAFDALVMRYVDLFVRLHVHVITGREIQNGVSTYQLPRTRTWRRYSRSGSGRVHYLRRYSTSLHFFQHRHFSFGTRLHEISVLQLYGRQVFALGRSRSQDLVLQHYLVDGLATLVQDIVLVTSVTFFNINDYLFDLFALVQDLAGLGFVRAKVSVQLTDRFELFAALATAETLAELAEMMAEEGLF